MKRFEQSVNETNISSTTNNIKDVTCADLSKQITNLENKINNMLNDKLTTKQIINITKDTLSKEKYKNNYFRNVIIIIILVFLGFALADILYYVFYKAQQIKIINNIVKENNLSNDQIKILEDKIKDLENALQITEPQTSTYSDKKDDDPKIQNK